jgi:precorrin-2 dehydrogenase / sirohydrochlorin ferrochelatase
MIYYPVFFDLRGRPVLVVGAGKVALRKAMGLVEAGARVTVVAPRWEPAFEQLPVTLLRRAFEPADVEGAFLVFAATDDRAVNRAAAILAKARGIPVNVADSPAECDFLAAARVRRGNLQVAISTGGEDPRRAVALRRRIAEILEGE